MSKVTRITTTSKRPYKVVLPAVPMATYGASPVKHKKRSTAAEWEMFKLSLFRIVEAGRTMTVRQVFYRGTVEKLVEKTEQGYKRVCRALAVMRREGMLPFSWLADNTRWMRKPKTYKGLRDLARQTSKLYRRSLWANQLVNVEIWLEKDALSGVLYEITSEFDVSLMVTRGYPSLSFLYSAADAIADSDKPTWIYYFGDADPSGLDIPRRVEQDIRAFAPDAEVHFQRVAVTDEQIAKYDLPSRPTKRSDSRAKDFDRESVEVDALLPQVLRDICRRCIEQHIDQSALATLQTAEASERDYLLTWAKQLGGAA